MLLIAILLVLVQAGLGMAVNLYVVVPGHHPGAHPANYLSGSFHSVAWALAHGSVGLAVHAALGLLLVLAAIGVATQAVRLRRRALTVLATLGGLFVVGAGFNGASFLDFDNDVSSLIMSLLAFAALGCYAGALFLVTASPSGTR